MRNYQKQLENEIALKKTYVKRRKGCHFDPDLVGTFLSIKEEILWIKNEYEDAEQSWLFSKAQTG